MQVSADVGNNSTFRDVQDIGAGFLVFPADDTHPPDVPYDDVYQLSVSPTFLINT
jgi:hypothetical protein